MSYPATLLPPVREEYERSLEPLGEIALEVPLPLNNRIFYQTWVRKVLIALALVILWEAAARGVNNDLLLPTFGATLRAFVQGILSGELLRKTTVSMWVLLRGYLLGATFAFLLTTLAVSTRIGRDLLSMLTAMLNPLPSIALLPLALLWFGLGTGSLLFVLVHAVLWPVALNMEHALVAEASGADTWCDEAVLARVAAIARGPLAAAAPRIDGEGVYPLDIMGELGAAGALGVHLDRYGARFGLSLAAMQEASRARGSTGFLMWAHDVCGLYMEQSGNPYLGGARLDAHACGQTFGGTALSNPMKAFSGIEPMTFRATPTPGGYLINGTLPWVSHIGLGQYCGAIAGVHRDDGSVSHEVMFLLNGDERVELRHCPVFSGMEGTSTWRVKLTNHFVGEADLIADPVRPFVARIKAAFILLQVGMALGVAQGGIDSCLEVEPVLGHVNRFLHDRPDELTAELDEAVSATQRLARTAYDGSTDYLLEGLCQVDGCELSFWLTRSYPY